MEFKFQLNIEIATDWVAVRASVPSSLSIKRNKLILKYDTGQYIEIWRNDRQCFITANGFRISKRRVKVVVLKACDLEVRIETKYPHSIAVNYTV